MLAPRQLDIKIVKHSSAQTKFYIRRCWPRSRYISTMIGLEDRCQSRWHLLDDVVEHLTWDVKNCDFTSVFLLSCDSQGFLLRLSFSFASQSSISNYFVLNWLSVTKMSKFSLSELTLVLLKKYFGKLFSVDIAGKRGVKKKNIIKKFLLLFLSLVEGLRWRTHSRT